MKNIRKQSPPIDMDLHLFSTSLSVIVLGTHLHFRSY
jgi:hypothetical protein